MIKDKIHDNSFNKCEKDTNSDEKMITINKSKLIDDISNLIRVVLIFGISVGAMIMLLIAHLVRFSQ